MTILDFIHNIQLFFLIIKAKSKNALIIYDIDNTVAITYKNISKDGKINFSTLEAYSLMLKKIQTELDKKNNLILFFTVRPLSSWFVTLNWLKKYSLLESNINLLLCNKPINKIDLIRKIKKYTSIDIEFIDDMSYNHENDKIKFYDYEIEQIKKLNIKYLGYNEIQKIVNT